MKRIVYISGSRANMSYLKLCDLTKRKMKNIELKIIALLGRIAIESME
ncbi:hypothetical protein [Enterobacter cloacae complex sp. 358K9]